MMTRRALDLTAGAVLVTLCVFGMRPFELRMASFYFDDSPVHYAHAFATPERYTHDVMLGVPTPVVLPSRVVTSAMVWAPALLLKHAAVDPYETTKALTALQAFLLGASIFVLAVVMTGRRDLALLAAIVSMVSAPWVWSPANFGNDAGWNFIPYPANLATGVLLLSLAAALRRRVAIAQILCAAGGLIHPLLGLYAALILAAYWVITARQEAGGMPWRRLAGTATATLVFMVPAAWGSLSTADPLPASELMPGLALNAHIFPWRVAGWWSGSAQQTAACLLLAAAAWARAEARPYRAIWFAALAGACLFSLAHVAGALFDSPLLLTLVGLRAWMWPVLVSLPVVFLGIWRALETGSIAVRFAAAALVIAPFVAGRYAMPLPLGAALASAWIAPRLGARARLAGEGVSWIAAAAWCALVWAVPMDAARNETPLAEWWRMLCGAVNPPSMTIGIALPLAVAVLARLVSWRRPDEPAALRRVAWLRWAGVAAATAFVLSTARAAAADATRPGTSDSHGLDVASWARAKAPADATFLVVRDGWRTMAQRAGVEPFTRESYAYIAPRAAEQWRERLLAFYGISREQARAGRGPAISRLQRERFAGMAEADFLRFSTLSGATHAVIPVCYPQTARTAFDLPLAYENPCYRVYEISPTAIEAVRRREEEAGRRVLAEAAFATGFGKGAHPGLQVAAGTIVADPSNRFEQALRFGPATRPLLPPSAIDLSAGTVAVWARLGTPVPDYADVLRLNANGDLYLYLTASQFHLLYGGKLIGAAPVTIDEQWHHYAVVWQNREQHLYIDGRRRLSGTEPASASPTSMIALGWLGDRDGEQWSGDIGHVATFRRPLTAAEIVALAAAHRPRR